MKVSIDDQPVSSSMVVCVVVNNDDVPCSSRMSNILDYDFDNIQTDLTLQQPQPYLIPLLEHIINSYVIGMMAITT